MKSIRYLPYLTIALMVLIILSGCTWFSGAAAEFPKKEMLVEEPGGGVLSIPEGALDQKAEVKVEEVGIGEPLGAGSPLTAASNEYVVEWEDAQQIGAITMKVPLIGASKLSAPASPEKVYLTWAEPYEGTPSVVGTIVSENQAEFPVVGPGKYQVYSITSHEALLGMFSVFDPLEVPTYQQRTPAWCSPTAMTNLVQFHEGAWLSGGYGSIWGESSNYYLAGQANQPFDHGYFFHWLLEAGGYTTPADVKQSFSDGNVEVVIWNWKAGVESGFFNAFYAEVLFNAFQAYVESYLWGENEPARPVAWGSSLAGHSRTITGSDGTNLYYNDPGSGSLNQVRAWEEYKNAVLASLTEEKVEVIDTVVFHAPPRPAEERTGSLWLFPGKEMIYPGSVALVSGETGLYLTKWYWDGSGSHSYGYYYEDWAGVLEADPVLGVQFEVFHYQDEIELSFGVKNITNQNQEYQVNVFLIRDGGSVNELVHSEVISVPAGGRVDSNPATRFGIVSYDPGLYRLKFVLQQGGIIVDTKWVYFRLNSPDHLIIDPRGFVLQQAFCRVGPDPVFDAVIVYDRDTEVKLVGTNPERTWGLFEKEVDSEIIRCWMAFSVVDTRHIEEAAVLPVPTRPTVTPTFACSDYTTVDACTADSRCSWVYGIGPGYCTEK